MMSRVLIILKLSAIKQKHITMKALRIAEVAAPRNILGSLLKVKIFDDLTPKILID